MDATAHVPLPQLTLEEDATPRSVAFGDVYFSRHGGVAETTHVFLAGNALPKRWCVAAGEPRSGGGLGVIPPSDSKGGCSRLANMLGYYNEDKSLQVIEERSATAS